MVQAPHQTTAIDCQTLEDLRRFTDDPEVFYAVLHTYLQETPQLLATLQTAVTMGDASAMQRTAHSLKSSSAVLGALALSSLCAELETVGGTKVTVDAATILSQMAAEYEAVRVALTNELERCSESSCRS